ncbi:hypothetical protein Trydic_g14087 [Trypoxylus dichotomus]
MQGRLDYLTADNAENYEKEVGQREKFLDSYYDLTSSAQLLLSSHAEINDTQSPPESRSGPGRPTRSIKLPIINLPTFDGSFTQWSSFLDSFNTVIHNNTELGNSQKNDILKGRVRR